MIIIDIEIKDRSRIKEFFHKLHNKFEDAVFFIIQHMPAKLVPSFIMAWLDRCITKRMHELQQQVTKQRWQQLNLEKVVTEIHNQQKDTGKAPSED